MPASRPIASELWHRRKMTRGARSWRASPRPLVDGARSMRWALQIGDDRQAASQCRRLKYGPRLCFRNGPAAGSTRDRVAASRPWPRERTGTKLAIDGRLYGRHP
jgi:hypothetical protein